MCMKRQRRETEENVLERVELYDGNRLILRDPEEDVSMEIEVAAAVQMDGYQYILGVEAAEEDSMGVWPEDDEEDTEAFILKVCTETEAMFWASEWKPANSPSSKEFAVTTDLEKNELKRATELLMSLVDFDLEMEEDV